MEQVGGRFVINVAYPVYFFTSVFNFLLVGDFFLESVQFNKNFSGTRQFVYEICIESLFGGTLAPYDCQYF